MTQDMRRRRGARPRSTGNAPRRAGLALLLLALATWGAASSPAAEPRASTGLTGQLLVATAEMGDPRFARTVIYMIHHDANGAQGVAVNRPLGELPLALLLERAGLDARGAQGVVRLHAGGPVEPRRVLVLHTADYAGDGTLAVAGGIAVTTHPGILAAIAGGKGPRRALITLGYAGWAPGQIEEEIKRGAWVRADAEEVLVFDHDYDTKWERATARRKVDL